MPEIVITVLKITLKINEICPVGCVNFYRIKVISAGNKNIAYVG